MMVIGYDKAAISHAAWYSMSLLHWTCTKLTELISIATTNPLATEV